MTFLIPPIGAFARNTVNHFCQQTSLQLQLSSFYTPDSRPAFSQEAQDHDSLSARWTKMTSVTPNWASSSQHLLDTDDLPSLPVLQTWVHRPQALAKCTVSDVYQMRTVMYPDAGRYAGRGKCQPGCLYQQSTDMQQAGFCADTAQTSSCSTAFRVVWSSLLAG